VVGGWPTGAYYEPSDAVAPYEQSAYPYPTGTPPAASYPVIGPIQERVIQVITYRPGCNSQTETVPWRDGSDHAVTIVRC
jgi:hypothetical protein